MKDTGNFPASRADALWDPLIAGQPHIRGNGSAQLDDLTEMGAVLWIIKGSPGTLIFPILP